MEVQTCAYASPNVSNSNSDYYGKINITSFILCFIIIYSTALSIILSIIQLIQVIKEDEDEDEEDEEEDEEIIKEEEVINEEDKEKNEEELLLANYNAKERALALQAAYEERAKLTFEKWREAFVKLYKANPVHVESATHQYRTLLSKMQEEYLETNEKLTRLEAFNALKKARTIELKHYKEFIHLFNS
jgi:hypothetical protein